MPPSPHLRNGGLLVVAKVVAWIPWFDTCRALRTVSGTYTYKYESEAGCSVRT